jgi:hypothetical protein
MAKIYQSTCNYEEKHPDALAVYCSDGRFTGAVEYLAHSLGISRFDTLTIPGGPGLLELTSGTSAAVETVRTAVGFLAVGHNIAHAVLIAHEGCGYYRNRFAYESPPAMLRRQLSDLNAAGRFVATTRAGIVVTKFYARVVAGHVLFEPVE